VAGLRKERNKKFLRKGEHYPRGRCQGPYKVQKKGGSRRARLSHLKNVHREIANVAIRLKRGGGGVGEQ